MSRIGVSAYARRRCQFEPKGERMLSDYARNQGISAVHRYREGTGVLASYTAGDYTAVIMEHERPLPPHWGENAQVLYVRADRPTEPVLSGIWMDRPEEHWRLPAKWTEIPREQRAAMEAEEQAVVWAPEQYEELWLRTYVPEDWQLLWDKGYQYHSEQKYQREVHKLFLQETEGC